MFVCPVAVAANWASSNKDGNILFLFVTKEVVLTTATISSQSRKLACCMHLMPFDRIQSSYIRLFHWGEAAEAPTAHIRTSEALMCLVLNLFTFLSRHLPSSIDSSIRSHQTKVTASTHAYYLGHFVSPYSLHTILGTPVFVCN
jgi:hypothetical protein